MERCIYYSSIFYAIIFYLYLSERKKTVLYILFEKNLLTTVQKKTTKEYRKIVSFLFLLLNRTHLIFFDDVLFWINSLKNRN